MRPARTIPAGPVTAAAAGKKADPHPGCPPTPVGRGVGSPLTVSHSKVGCLPVSGSVGVGAPTLMP